MARFFQDLNPNGSPTGKILFRKTVAINFSNNFYHLTFNIMFVVILISEGEFQCHWKNCARVKKGVNPFPSLGRLLKHVKDIHIMKGNGRIIHPEMRSK